MSEFIYHLHYRLGFKEAKLDGLSRCSEKEKSGIDAHFFDEGQLLDLENDDVREAENVEDVELQWINIAI